MAHSVERPDLRTAERRRIARQKSLLRGTIYFDNRRRAVECVIRDISPYGARLTFAGTVTVPDMLDLTIPQQDRTVRAHVIWRHAQGSTTGSGQAGSQAGNQEIGVAFPQAAALDPVAAAADSGDLTERVARLELEIAALKRVLKKMKSDAGPEFDVA